MSGVPVAGGGAGDADDRQLASDVRTAQATQLKGVRTAAQRWQTGLAGLGGSIAIFGLVKGRDDVDALADGWGVAYGILLALALLAALMGGVFAMRAAFGLPRVQATDQLRPTRDDAAEARLATKRLWAAIWATCASIVLVGATLAVAWYGPDSSSPKLQVHRVNGTADCGEIVRIADGRLEVKIGGGESSVPLAQLDGLEAVTKCPSP